MILDLTQTSFLKRRKERAIRVMGMDAVLWIQTGDIDLRIGNRHDQVNTEDEQNDSSSIHLIAPGR